MTINAHIGPVPFPGAEKIDKEAFSVLFKTYGPKIYRFALNYLRNKPDAEELTQDVFLKIWEKRFQLDPKQNIKAYIFKIAVNAIYDLIRRKNIERAFNDYASKYINKEAGSLWEEIIWNDMLSKLDILVQKFPEQRRTIFLMSREEGLSNQQIAEKLNLSKRTVENQLYRALQFLKEHFNKDSGSLLLALLLYL